MPHAVLGADQPVLVRHIDDTSAWLTLQRHDPVNQLVATQELWLDTDGTWRMLPFLKRNLTLPELDITARAANLHLQARYDGWDRRLPVTFLIVPSQGLLGRSVRYDCEA